MALKEYQYFIFLYYKKIKSFFYLESANVPRSLPRSLWPVLQSLRVAPKSQTVYSEMGNRPYRERPLAYGAQER